MSLKSFPIGLPKTNYMPENLHNCAKSFLEIVRRSNRRFSSISDGSHLFFSEAPGLDQSRVDWVASWARRRASEAKWSAVAGAALVFESAEGGVARLERHKEGSQDCRAAVAENQGFSGRPAQKSGALVGFEPLEKHVERKLRKERNQCKWRVGFYAHDLG